MNLNRMIHTPEGFRDLYGSEASLRRRLMEDLHRVFAQYGYEDIETPLVEYFDVFGNEVGTTPSNELYKFFDRDGNTLVLRPDFTPSVARAVAMHVSAESLPLRLCYQGKTYVNSQEYMLLLKEETQMGVELIGDAAPEADAEVLHLTCRLLEAAGLEDFQLSIGENNYFKSLSQASGLDAGRIEEVRQLISNKNFFGVSELMEGSEVPPSIREAFVKMPQLFGGSEVLSEARSYAEGHEGALEAIERLRAIDAMLRERGCEKHISYDFGLLNKYHYYTGMIFSAFTFGVGEPIAKGGRYDQLLTHFGMDAPAVGVGVNIDLLQNALHRRRL